MGFTLKIISAAEYDAFMGLRVPTERLQVEGDYDLMLRFEGQVYKAGHTATRIARLIPNPNVTSQVVMLHLADEEQKTPGEIMSGLHRNGLLTPDQTSDGVRGTRLEPSYIIGGYLLERHMEHLEAASGRATSDLTLTAS